jgi:two-component system, OmpR family, response regulator VicR
MSGEQILIVEDERAVARSLEYALAKEGFTSLWAENGQSALEITRAQNPHLILLDIRLPDQNGFDILRSLRSEGKRQPVIILTARDEEVDKVIGFELGADDYIVKPYQLHELIARIRAHLRRAYGDLATPAAEERISFGDIELDPETFQVHRGGEAIFLTPIEFRLLRYLASHPKHPFDRETLVEAIWGYDEVIGDIRTIDVHIRHLREKLETDPANPRYLVTVRGLGYKFEP